MFTSTCPSCGENIDVPELYHKKEIKCTSCHNYLMALTPEERLFEFQCPFCEGNIEAAWAWVGVVAPCPHCNVTFEIPKPDILMKQIAPIISEPPSFRSIYAQRNSPEAKKQRNKYVLIVGVWTAVFAVVLLFFIIIAESSRSHSSVSRVTLPTSTAPTVYQRALKEAPNATYRQGYESARRSGLKTDIEPMISLFRDMKCSDAFISGYRSGCADNARRK